MGPSLSLGVFTQQIPLIVEWVDSGARQPVFSIDYRRTSTCLQQHKVQDGVLVDLGKNGKGEEAMQECCKDIMLGSESGWYSRNYLRLADSRVDEPRI